MSVEKAISSTSVVVAGIFLFFMINSIAARRGQGVFDYLPSSVHHFHFYRHFATNLIISIFYLFFGQTMPLFSKCRLPFSFPPKTQRDRKRLDQNKR